MAFLHSNRIFKHSITQHMEKLIFILTDHRFVAPENPDWYAKQVMNEDAMLAEALRTQGYSVKSVDWADPGVDWHSAEAAIFRSTWDYFDRYAEFKKWFEETQHKVRFINPVSLLEWNMDKHYLKDLEARGMAIVPSIFMKTGDVRSLAQLLEGSTWKEYILKPCVSGCARHTYHLKPEQLKNYEELYTTLIKEEPMMLQEFQESISSQGEVSHMVMGGRYTHSILKHSKEGDFRVQDDFGGTVHPYTAAAAEIAFAEKAFASCNPIPLYGRVDVMWDNDGSLRISEMELIEPELWFRFNPEAARILAEVIDGDLRKGG